MKKKRNFELQLRPPFVWNFFETRKDKEEKVKIGLDEDEKEAEKEEQKNPEDQPYLINHNADPSECYHDEEVVQKK